MNELPDVVRVAIASDDGENVRKHHFGAATGYEIFDISEDGTRHVERRGPVPDKEGHGPQEALAVIRHLTDRRVFAGGSMGRKSREFLLERGIVALVVHAETVREVLDVIMIMETWSTGACGVQPSSRRDVS